MLKNNSDRFEYLQTLVTEFQDTDSDGEFIHLNVFFLWSNLKTWKSFREKRIWRIRNHYAKWAKLHLIKR